MVDKIVNLPQPELSLKDALIKSLQGSEEAQTDHFNEVYARLLRTQADIAEGWPTTAATVVSASCRTLTAKPCGR